MQQVATEFTRLPIDRWLHTRSRFPLGTPTPLVRSPILGPPPTDQTTENQTAELRRYVEARGWTLTREYCDHVSGAKDLRTALGELLQDAKRRRFDVVACWRLDRLGRNLKHLITLLDELQALGIAFVSLAEGIDATTPAGHSGSFTSLGRRSAARVRPLPPEVQSARPVSRGESDNPPRWRRPDRRPARTQ